MQEPLMSEIRHDENHEGMGFEKQDLGSRPVYGFLISLVVVGVLLYYVIWGMFHFLDAFNRKREAPANPMVRAEQDTREPDAPHTNLKIQQEFPEPRLEDNERTELAPFRYEEEQKLNSYGWVDQNAGVAHIPITKAMELIAQRGLPTTPQAGTAPISTVGMAKAAAAVADTRNAQNTGKTAGKGKKQ
jgi:hypothetical protein